MDMDIDITELTIRPIAESDIDFLCHISNTIGYGFTSLPKNRDYNLKRIHTAQQSFAGKIAHDRGLYLFVMETDEHSAKPKQFAGLCGIKAGVGISEPFYSFKLTTEQQVCAQLNKRLDHVLLTITTDFKGATELISLYLAPDFRGGRRAEFLSRSRLVFIAEFSDWFADSIISEIRGVTDNNGYSAFWEAVGRPFYAMNFAEADNLTGLSSKQFIADLMPRYPIYKDLLPVAAQALIGKSHPSSAPAKHILTKEGMQFNDHVDIFDAGPLINAEKNKLRTINNSQYGEIVTVEKKSFCSVPTNKYALAIIANTRSDFRAKLGYIKLITAQQVNIDNYTAKILKVDQGDKVRFCLFDY